MIGSKSETAADTGEAAPSAPLSWGLLIATKDRLEPLKTCVRLALEQTRPPSEVIIVDASQDWERNSQEIAGILAERPEIRFAYRAAEVASLTGQRNQALAESEGDIVFMIDDDSFLFPTSAEEIMKIYEADRAGKVAGVQLGTSDKPPEESISAPRKEIVDVVSIRRSSRALKWLLRKVFLMSMEEIFIPYDGAFYERPIPENIRSFDVAPARIFGGYRMTFRRENVMKEPFDSILRYYCPGEDLDASYRISRTGCLLNARSARVYHHLSAANRLNHYQVALLWLLNQAVLLQRHAADKITVRRSYHRLMRRRVLAAVLRDALTRRLTFPQTRGTFRAWRTAPRIFAMSNFELEAWYPEKQTRIVKG